MTTLEKFSSVLPLLCDAIDRQITLDIEYPAVYNRVNRHYEERGVSFYGDVDEDYDILLDKLETDLYSEANAMDL